MLAYCNVDKNIDTSNRCLWGSIWIVIASVAVLAISMSMLPSDWAWALVKENGPVEVLTALGYVMAAGLLFLETRRGEILTGYSASFIVLLLGMRELDFHARFTTMGIFKTRFYISPDVPLAEKVIATAIVIAIFFVVIRFGRRNFSSLVQGIRDRYLPAVATAFAIGFALLSKMLDSFSDPLEWFFATFHSDPSICMQVTEENMELAIPVFILVAFYNSSRIGKNQ